MIKLENVVKNYGDIKALQDISFEIKSGEIVGLLGPNGAGKSTTMKILTGFIIPDEGEVTIEGKAVKDNLVFAKSLIGYMPENNPLYKEMIVEEAINLSMDLHNVPHKDRKKKVKSVVKSTGIQDVFYRPISELSKGYKQRVGIAQVLVHDPKILILDEPTEGLDPNQRTEIRNLIKSLGKDRTVVISTHVMQEVEAMCNRILIINKGKVILDDSKESITNKRFNTNEVIFAVKNDTAKITQNDLKDLKVKSIAEINDNKKVAKFRISAENLEVLFKDISELVKKNNWIIYELSTKQLNLEDLFRELTKTEK